MFSDAHLHIMSDDIICAARQAGVQTFVCNTVGQGQWLSAIAFCEKHPEVHMCFGIHPWQILNIQEGWQEELENILIMYPDAMLGEVGLDKTHDSFEIQCSVFETILALAQKYNRPVSIHCVKAWPELYKILKNYPGLTCLFHRFNGDGDVVKSLINICNAYFSVFRVKCLSVIPVDRLLVESDAPDGLNSPVEIPALVKQMGLDPIQIQQNLEAFLDGR